MFTTPELSVDSQQEKQESQAHTTTPSASYKIFYGGKNFFDSSTARIIIKQNISCRPDGAFQQGR